MKNLYILATSALLALTACSNDSAVSNPTVTLSPSDLPPVSLGGSTGNSSFETDGCKKHLLSLQKNGSSALETPAFAPMPEARLIQNGNSYQIEILDVVKNCGLSNDNATTTTERVGNTLNVEIDLDMLAKCGACLFDLRININQNEASARYVSFNGTTYLIVSQYTPQAAGTDTTTQSSHSLTYLADFTHSDCKAGDIPLSSIVNTTDGISDTAAMPSINLIENEGSYHLLLNDVVRSCDFKPVTSVSRLENSLAIDIQDTSDVLSDCICSYDFNIEIKPEDADAKYVLFDGTTYKVASLKAATQICYPSTNLKTLAKTDEYGMALGECKNTNAPEMKPNATLENIILAEKPTATLITEDSITQVLIPDVLDNCKLKASFKVSMTDSTIYIEYDNIYAEATCVCVTDHWFDISSLGAENIAKATQVEFSDKTYALVR